MTATEMHPTPSDPTTSPLIGRATLTHGDNIRILLLQLGRTALIFGWVFFLLLYAYGIMNVSVYGVSLFDDPVSTLLLALDEIWQSVVIACILFPLFILVVSTIKWTRFPMPNKIITYTADETGITTSDAAGASLHLPWTMVKSSFRTRHYVVMKMKPAGLRFAPLRGFENPEALWQLVRSNTPAR